MKIYYISDLHNDYNKHNKLLDFEGDPNGVLIVAGDINSKGRSIRDLEAVSARWKAIVAVAGNHDWWGLALHETHKFETTKDNVHFLMEDSVKIGGVIFCGTTLWHPVGDWFEEQAWRYTMNDVKKIRGKNFKSLSKLEIEEMHSDGIRFISSCTDVYKDFPKILITHHALSNKSIGERYKHSTANKYFATHLPYLLEGFDYHIHGHIHSKSNYVEKGCNVLCNPLGYGHEVGEVTLESFEIG